MEHTKTWKQLAFAFFSLAHGDFSLFRALPEELKETEVGQLCQKYIETGESELIDKAGRLLTGGSKHWYTYLGRTF